MAEAPYTPRIIDGELDTLLPEIAAIAVEGAKGVGKTVTCARRARTRFALDDPAVGQLIAADATVIDGRARPVLLDEWQRHPEVWDHVRRRVDDGAAAGSYLLTGSAAPQGAPVHSGAGRIFPLRMRPMSLAEREIETPTVSLAALLTGARPDLRGHSVVAVRDYADEIVASGFPGIRRLSARARRAQLDGYLARVVDREFPDLGLVVRRPETLRRWLTAYAAATSTTASYNSLLDAATGGESSKPAKTTTIAYRDVLNRLFLLDEVLGWTPARSSLRRVGQAPKHHLADPALAARLLGIEADGLVDPSGPAGHSHTIGPLFESLVSLSVKTYAQAAEATVGHFRSGNGDHEVDLIVERADHKIVAIEVKLSATVGADTVSHLAWLGDRLGDDLLDAVVITTGPDAYRRKDGIAVVPGALLGP